MTLDRRKLFIYAAVGLVVIAVGARTLLSRADGSSGVQALSLADLPAAQAGSPATPSAAPGGGASPAAPAELVVDVRGAVARPGVYHLAQGSRVCDLLEAAGGAAADADLAAVNPAARLADGQQVVVPREGEAPPESAGSSTGAGGSATAGPVNLNTATLEQLDTLPGVGPSTAQKIIDYRSANGGFRSVDELNDVPGIGDARFETLKDLVTV